MYTGWDGTIYVCEEQAMTSRLGLLITRRE
jgi:hypothetical protein